MDNITMISTNVNSLQSQLANLDSSAKNIATKSNEADFNLISEIKNQIVNENGIKLNIKAIQVQDENLGTLLDIVG